MGQEGFYGVPDLGNIKNLCVGQGKCAVKDIPFRVGKCLKPGLPTFHNPRVRRPWFKKL
jgi:hypothetical protein